MVLYVHRAAFLSTFINGFSVQCNQLCGNFCPELYRVPKRRKSSQWHKHCIKYPLHNLRSSERRFFRASWMFNAHHYISCPSGCFCMRTFGSLFIHSCLTKPRWRDATADMIYFFYAQHLVPLIIHIYHLLVNVMFLNFRTLSEQVPA